MAATHVVQLATYDTPQIALAVRIAARQDGVTVARWVRAAIRKRLKEIENAKGKAS